MIAPVVTDDGHGDRTVDRGERRAWGHSAAHERPLRESLEDASVLLWFATREGKPVSEETVAHIVRLSRCCARSVGIPRSKGSSGSRFAISPRPSDRCRSIPFWRPTAIRSATTAGPAGADRLARIVGRAGRPATPGGRGDHQEAVQHLVGRRSLLSAVRADLLVHRHDLPHRSREASRRAGSHCRVVAGDGSRGQSRAVHGQPEGAGARADRAGADGRGASELLRRSARLASPARASSKHEREQSRLILAYANVTRRGSRVILMLKGNSAMLTWWDVFTDLAGLTGDGAQVSTMPAGAKIIPRRRHSTIGRRSDDLLRRFRAGTGSGGRSSGRDRQHRERPGQ